MSVAMNRVVEGEREGVDMVLKPAVARLAAMAAIAPEPATFQRARHAADKNRAKRLTTELSIPPSFLYLSAGAAKCPASLSTAPYRAFLLSSAKFLRQRICVRLNAFARCTAVFLSRLRGVMSRPLAEVTYRLIPNVPFDRSLCPFPFPNRIATVVK